MPTCAARSTKRFAVCGGEVNGAPTEEERRLEAAREGRAPWRRWGPYLAERQWGTVREDYQVIILSDTFYEFARPLMQQLGQPTLFCHSLEADASGMLVDYRLRMPDQKREAVQRLRELNFEVVAAGDSYNDTAMLGAAHRGILFHPPENVVREFPQFPVTRDYGELMAAIDAAAARI